MADVAFQPAAAATVNIDVSSSSQSVALGGNPNGGQLRIMNNGTATVWANFGTSAITAALATGFPIGAGVTEVLTIPNFGGAPYVAVIAAGSTGKVYFTPGSGF